MKIKREGDRELYVQIKIVFKNRYYRDRFVELLKRGEVTIAPQR